MTDQERAIRDELEIHGAVVTRVADGGKHQRIYFEWRGVERFHVVATSPSDPMASEYARRDIRRMLGVTRKIHKNPANKARKRNRTEPKAAPDLACEARENPFNVLAEHPLSGGCHE